MPNRSVISYLVGITAIVLIGRLAQKRTYYDRTNDRAQNTKRNLNKLDSLPAHSKTQNRSHDAKEESHWAQEEIFWRQTSRYTLVAIVISGLALAAAGAAFYQALRQADAANDSNRPWIEFADVQFSSPLKFADKVGSVGLDFTMENTGHSPALRVDLKQMMFTRKPTSAVEMRKVAEMCSEERKVNYIYGAGVTIFPGQKKGMRMIVVMNEMEATQFQNHSDYVVMIAGCVEYTFTLRGETHRTFFVANIDKIGNANTPFLALPRGLNLIPSADLVLASNPSLEGSAD